MPQHKSCKKRLITNAIRNQRNRINRTYMRAQVKSFREAVASGTEQDTAKELTRMYSILDTQTRKGILKKKTASRYKARLASMVAK